MVHFGRRWFWSLLQEIPNMEEMLSPDYRHERALATPCIVVQKVSRSQLDTRKLLQFHTGAQQPAALDVMSRVIREENGLILQQSSNQSVWRRVAVYRLKTKKLALQWDKTLCFIFKRIPFGINP